MPVGKKAEGAQIGIGKRAANGNFRHSDNGFVQPLIHHFIEGQKHQGAGFTGGRGRFKQQILRVSGCIGPRLHLAHTHRILRGALPCLPIVNG
ncbi:hypothetical protein [Desulfovibrio sp. 1188_IL3213]|uniref:hypothetical protein n=1 Tax=Desulfovibrio sp. 1188_IL3213 TaxID=3084052 RepID=UPI002FD91F69